MLSSGWGWFHGIPASTWRSVSRTPHREAPLPSSRPPRRACSFTRASIVTRVASRRAAGIERSFVVMLSPSSLACAQRFRARFHFRAVEDGWSSGFHGALFRPPIRGSSVMREAGVIRPRAEDAAPQPSSSRALRKQRTRRRGFRPRRARSRSASPMSRRANEIPPRR
jgi:hypothetical protein